MPTGRPGRPPAGIIRGKLVDCHGGSRELLQVEILPLLNRHTDAVDVAVLELARRLIVLADRVAAVAADAEAVAGKGELTELGLHLARSDRLFIDVEGGRTKRFAQFTRLFADELHAQRIFARLEHV